MEQGCFIGIDQGSSSTKAVVVGMDGKVLFTAKRELPQAFREGPRVEQDPSDILGSVRAALDETAGWAKSSGLDLLGAGLSCQRSSCLVWNEATGEPVSPVISWRDTRGSSFVDRLAEKKERIFELTGLPLTPYYSASKLRWLSENVPASGEKTTVFGTLSSFLTQRLTGSTHAVIDHTNAARTQLMDIGTLAWSPELLAIFNLEDIRLPKIVPTIGAHGKIGTPAGEVPLLACIGDQQAALLGLGVTSEGECGINYGTGAFLLVNTGRTLARVPGLISSVHYSRDEERFYLLEGSVNAAGDALEWLRGKLKVFGGYDEVDDLCWSAAEDVVAFLAPNGTGAPHWETTISSGLAGLTAASGPHDIVRAAVEGIAFFIRDIADAVRSAGIEPAGFIASGGLSSISYLAQAQADLLAKEVALSASLDASARGAAYLAGIGRGTWSAAAISDFTAGNERILPRANPGLLRRYRRWTAFHESVRAMDRIS